jgi:hypothetical protein
MPNQPLQLPTVAVEDGRLEHLVVVRESPQYDYLLMEGMIGQTVGRLCHLPGAKDVLAAGIEPVHGTGPFRTFQYRKHGTSAVMFEHQGVLYLYSLGSAAKANIDDRENAFVELLIDVIEHYRPRNVYVATFSRLVRSTEFAGRLQRAVNAHVDVVHSGEQQIRPKTADGKIMWTMLALMADMERDLIIQRLFAGMCNAYQRGRWVLNEEAVPPGYVLDPDTKIVTPNPSMVEPVGLLLTMMADSTMPSRRIIDAAGEAGLTSAAVRRIHGPEATFADIIRADSKLASLVDWIDTYETGRAVITHPNPFPGATNFGPLKVEGASSSSPGVVRFSYDWGLPEGGWAPPEILLAARARCRGNKERRSATGGAAHYKRKPFAGWVEWQDDTHRYHLSGSSAHYVLLRQRNTVEETD